MAQQLGDLLKKYGEPPEIKLIKDFVMQEVNIEPKVTLADGRYIISVPSAAAAGVLRTSVYKLQQQLGNDKRVSIRIS